MPKPQGNKSRTKRDLGVSSEHRRQYLVAGIGLFGALVGAVITFVATVVGTSAASADETGRQLREMKQQQYAAAYRAIDQEIISYSNMFELMRNGNVQTALKEAKEYSGRADVTGELASLPLVADIGVLETGSNLLQKRTEFLNNMKAIAMALDAGKLPAPEVTAAAAGKLADVRDAEGELLAAMRVDLDIP